MSGSTDASTPQSKGRAKTGEAQALSTAVKPAARLSEPLTRKRPSAKYRTSDAAFAELGQRGACPSTRANWHLATDWPEFARWSNEQTVVWLLVESLQGAQAIDEILEVPGIGAIVPGQFDLAQSMGLQGDVWHPRVTGLLRTIVARAGAKGIDTVAVLLGSDASSLSRELAFWKEAGVTTYWVGGDRRLFTLALRQRMTQVQAHLLSPQAPR